MARFIKSRKESAGNVPGSPVFIGKQKVEQCIVRVMDFDTLHLDEMVIDTIEDCRPYVDTTAVTWISVYGLHDVEKIQQLGEIFSMHPLALEDVLNTGQRPKFKEYDDTLFVVLKMLRFESEEEIVQEDQLSLVLGANYLLTFHEKPIDVFLPVRERIRKQRGRIRQCGPDYLAYAILDTVVDNYTICIEAIGSRIEDLEELVLEDPSQEVLGQITTYKREINYLRKSVRPAWELIINLMKSDTEIIRETTIPFLKDLQDLVSHAAETIDNYREMLTDQLGIYNTAVSNKLNEIMKILTIFAAIFIPLTFIAGIYGTNFEYLPELKFRYSYFIFWGIMVTVAAVMIRFFKKKGWM